MRRDLGGWAGSLPHVLRLWTRGKMDQNLGPWALWVSA